MTTWDEGPKRTAPQGEGVDERPEREAPAEGGEQQPGRVPEPSPEETPELLGERSDYPIAWDPEEES